MLMGSHRFKGAQHLHYKDQLVSQQVQLTSIIMVKQLLSQVLLVVVAFLIAHQQFLFIAVYMENN